MITFRYKYQLAGEKKVGRPVAEVLIKTSENEWVHFRPYIDSGADITLIPLSIGKILGFQISDNGVKSLGGIRGSIPVVYKNVRMRIGSREFPCEVAWALIEDVPPLLGRKDVFDSFEITFKQSEGLIIFEERT
ncbi:hypothetical protein A3D00_01740 [Candidatus Woesebacteria bacterium RIFCSPHIGHO2_02_FULL_38_9]|uniref:Peptidase A2 domain-containing protein n=1 Tax=Candidatus Woesebacteria bacterium RIFCSPHIGHO2_01_FULL_39_28 TaxID=1802496 RepID=A0A1F7YFL4_9BACT|nr:MAG: hypothetical protein A2627_03710 [Candidatus Woesebacteria bacterium RIFCSPHIGHO2_01_FULL_39_28]OGM33650.1 MAG: hypothetical protein A3D00_01740 [Candidatus Woesebacteria bacterium RIFCSPHIGHO2_02_FULL_38_9]OGM58529.1 MAG: hypothetical protein A3A50_00720 [Candidatus Woesebacteria bacterium RIFCSPLOWO2_01_FULL_38_20]